MSNLDKIHAWINNLKGPTGKDAFKKAILIAGKGYLDLDNSRAMFCYGMSKMTVKDENDKNAAAEFNVLKPVEFYEYIGRLAHEKFKNMPVKPLDQKINLVLDILLPKFRLSRRQVGVKEI